uniref:Uncharacterized protein n=1 Tax=Caenorhabditis japonica TaxID=281687 RepID=A0A8R1HLK6_CAEJA
MTWMTWMTQIAAIKAERNEQSTHTFDDTATDCSTTMAKTTPNTAAPMLDQLLVATTDASGSPSGATRANSTELASRSEIQRPKPASAHWTNLGPAKQIFTKRATKALQLIAEVDDFLASPNQAQSVAILQVCHRKLSQFAANLSQAETEAWQLLDSHPEVSSSPKAKNNNFGILCDHLNARNFKGLRSQMNILLQRIERKLEQRPIEHFRTSDCVQISHSGMKSNQCGKLPSLDSSNVSEKITKFSVENSNPQKSPSKMPDSPIIKNERSLSPEPSSAKTHNVYANFEASCNFYTNYEAEEFRSQSGISTKKKRNAFQMCGQSEFVHYDDGVQSLYGNGTVSDEDENENFTEFRNGHLIMAVRDVTFKGFPLRQKTTVTLFLGTLLLLSTSTMITVCPQLFDLSLPVLLMSTDSLEKWAIGCYIMWLITRVITDWHLTNSICDKLNSIIDDVRYVLRTHFKEFMTMKVHFSLEHLVPDLKYRGSPMLTSAAPFERLNQTLGRHTNVYTTRTLSDMATRFMSLQRALYLVRSAIYKPDCPVDFPTTLRHAIREDVPTACLLKYDHNPLSEEEQFFIDNSEHRIVHMRSEVRLESRTYKTRRQCDSDLAKSCYVYFIKHTGHTQFGSIERILLNDDGVKMVLLQEFETIDPFMNLLNTFHSEISNAKITSKPVRAAPVKNRVSMRTLGQPAKKKVKTEEPTTKVQNRGAHHNPITRQNVLPEMNTIPLTGNTATFLQDSLEDSMDAQSTYGEEVIDVENASDVEDVPTSSGAQIFSLSSHFNSRGIDDFERLKAATKEGNLKRMGELIQRGLNNSTITEVQLQEFASVASRPALGISDYVTELGSCSSLAETHHVLIGDKFANTIRSTEQRKIVRMEAKLHSLSEEVRNQHHISVIKRKQLSETYLLDFYPPSPPLNLNAFFERVALVGKNAMEQMTNVFVQLFKTSMTPSHKIWTVTFRPSTRRNGDVNFYALNDDVAMLLIDFGLDALGVHLPDALLTGPVPSTDRFVTSLNVSDPDAEIRRRRDCRDAAIRIVNSSIGRAFQNLRSYHYDIVTNSLAPCQARGVCSQHLRWDSVRKFRARLMKEGKPDEYTTEEAWNFQLTDSP